MKIKRSYAVALNNVLNNADKLFKAPIAGRFYYMVSTNKKATADEVKLTMEAFPYDEKYLEYEQRRINMLNEAGVYRNSDIPNLSEEARKDLEERITKFRDENLDVIKNEEAIDAERAKFMEEEIDLPLRTISIDDLPEIVAEDNWGVYNVIEPLIEG